MAKIKFIWARLNKTWCNFVHPSPLWPIHGEYRCPTCFRVYPVEWEITIHSPARAQ